MQIIDNSQRIALTSENEAIVMPVLQALDDKLKAKHGLEFIINVDTLGNKYLDIVKKKRGGFKRRKKGTLLD